MQLAQSMGMDQRNYSQTVALPAISIPIMPYIDIQLHKEIKENENISEEYVVRQYMIKKYLAETFGKDR